MYALLGICLALAALLGLKLCGAVVSLALWRALEPLTGGWSASARARLIFTLRVFPMALAAAWVLVFIVPAYVAYEPRHTDEVVGRTLLLLALVSALGLFFALRRVVATWAATQRLTREWMRRAEPVELEGVGVPAFRLRHRFPVIAVVGVLRPRLFVAEQVFGALDAEEFAAALRHERGHLRARDNLKRALLRASQDLLLLPPLGRSLLRTWRQQSEAAADEYAAAGGREAALALASALLKLSKLIPPGGELKTPVGAHLLGEPSDDVASRVRRLLQLASAEGARTAAGGAYASRLLAWACLLALCTSTAAALTHPETWKFTHIALEQVVENLR